MSVAIALERQLRAEGLAPIESHEVVRSLGADAVAVERWLAWAQDVLRKHPFASTRQREIWELYSSGCTIAQIRWELKASARGDVGTFSRGDSKRSITRAIERVTLAVGPAPVANPWLKSKRDVRVASPLERLARIAISLADRERLAELVQDDPELLKLIPKGDIMADKKPDLAPMPRAASVMQHYDRILLRDNVEVCPAGETPVLGARVRDRLIKVTGRQTVMGIIVAFDVKDAAGVEYQRLVTIPSWKIRQADQIVGGEE